jgi:predicted nucleic acid-binding protein
MTRLGIIETSWLDVPPTDELRDVARRILFAHTLRAADALQLAAALVVAGDRPADLPFVCLDQRLCDAARKEGFAVLP